MTESNILLSMRTMAWQRAKGELKSIMCAAYWVDNETAKQHDKFFDAVNLFIETVENEGLIE